METTFLFFIFLKNNITLTHIITKTLQEAEPIAAAIRVAVEGDIKAKALFGIKRSKKNKRKEPKVFTILMF